VQLGRTAAGCRRRGAAADARGELGHRLAGERALAVQRLEQRHAEREHVDAGVDRRARELLGRHVRDGADDRPDLRQRQPERRRGR
jgi:hypothetical protein